MMGPIYTAAFAGTALATTGLHDLIGIQASTRSRVKIHEICLGHRSTERLNFGVQILRGSTASSTSATIAPRHIHGWSGVPTAGSVVTAPSSELTSTASAVQLYADTFTENHWRYKPAALDCPIIDVSQRLHVRITQTSTLLPDVWGTIVFSEIGKPAG